LATNTREMQLKLNNYESLKEKLFIAALIIVSLLVFIGQYKRLKLETEANKAIIEGREIE